jgi:hypothetical protein
VTFRAHLLSMCQQNFESKMSIPDSVKDDEPARALYELKWRKRKIGSAPLPLSLSFS